MNTVRRFIEWNRKLSWKFDSWFIPQKFCIDGNRDFIDSFARKHLKEGLHVFDIGGGKNPYVNRATKDRLALTVVGVDIDAGELARAPDGLYDRTVCADITAYSGDGTADLVICQALLEHVKDVNAAFASINSILKPGGKAIIFVPSRNAVFARLNLLLPEKLKRWLLFAIFPQSRRDQGFPSYYNRCTPEDFRAMAESYGLKETEFRPYFQSTYFSFFFPVYAVWRLWMLLFWMLKRDQAAETFSVAYLKRPQSELATARSEHEASVGMMASQVAGAVVQQYRAPSGGRTQAR